MKKRDAQFDCPRRMDRALGFAPLSSEAYADACEEGMNNADGQDSWMIWNGRRCCSYCGSIHPDDFMEYVRGGGEVGPTDKNYKVYLDGLGHAKLYTPHLSRAQATEFRRMGVSETLHIGYPGYFYAGLYTHPPTREVAS